MAFAFNSRTRPALPAIALTLSWRGVPRSWEVKRSTGLVATALLALTALWYLGATAYLVFHDQLVASLISHQADVQYSYEDRIAVLQTQLEREVSRGLIDRRTLETTIDGLLAKSRLLEARSVAIDSVVRSIGGAPAALSSSRHGGRPSGGSSEAASSAPVSAQPGSDAQTALPHDDHAELSTFRNANDILAALDKVEARQAEGLALLRAPLQQKVERLQTALIETGLPSSRWHAPSKSGMGGPFVPLPEASRGAAFEQNLALLKAVLAEHTRLVGVAENVPLRRPIGGQIEVTSPFGARVDPFLGQAAMHTGMDLMSSYGAPVRATANGIVTIAGPEGGYGNMVEVDHGDGVVTRYAHLSSTEVVPRQRIVAGAVVGRVGSTGRSTGPHLHYETRINGVPVDPSRFLKAGSDLFPG